MINNDFFGRFSGHTVENQIKSHDKVKPIESEYILINIHEVHQFIMYIFIYLINHKRKPRFATNYKIKKNFISNR